MLERIAYIKDKIDKHSKECDVLTEEMMWSSHDALIWKANEFHGLPHFYPIYRWGDYFSYSMLALIVKKGNLNINPSVIEYCNKNDFLVLPASLTIDKDIQRIGLPHSSELIIKNVDELARRIVDALLSDIHRVEEKNKDYKNYILCGGKDSLNLLLLPWKQETIALSAEPNYELVKKFVDDNNLNIQVCKLEDKENDDELNDEVLACCCRVDMTNWRWGEHLREISKENNGKIIFWKGQLADVYTTDKWKVYMHPITPVKMFFRKVYKKLEPIIPFTINRSLGHALQPMIIKSLWERGAAMQGDHLGFLREIADCLVLSAYHGPEVMKVWQEIDMASVAQQDMRDRIGEILLDRPVKYPTENPAPEPSYIRNGMGKPEQFINLLRKGGIIINENRA